MSKSATVKDVPAAPFIKALAEHFKSGGQFDVPEYCRYIKTASFKELGPYDPDFYFVRAASIARKVYLEGGVGVGGLAKVYGGSARKGTRKCHFQRGSRGILRHILRQLDDMKIVQKKKGQKGRFITSTGQKTLDVIAKQLISGFKRPEFYEMSLAGPSAEDVEEGVEGEEVEEGEEGE
eukprot:CAMPEP_0185253856 /NCGR_PEP_ID=MMETSP1359-20130426/2422_1 /TAXON_ID=552665 /ORGANISM="Bigelowiella longifila, Strain CCMP242" /LENGTH=178 /DNA_ID=CAMNT_0027836285 /DNA_START=24 /DNA_END=560 /DNA_ORIENTATION=+